MASENRFYRKDYPKFLKKELNERFTQHAKTSGYEPDGNEGPIGSTIDLKTFIWNEGDKDYNMPGATFKNGRLEAFEVGGIISDNVKFTDTVFNQGYIPNELRPGRGFPFEELLRIKDVNIDIGGRVGSLSKAKISFEMRGESMFEKFTKYVTQIGTKIELEVNQYWRGQATAIRSHQADANKLIHFGRVYNYTFSYKGQYWWEGTIDTVGLAEMLAETNILLTFPESVAKKVAASTKFDYTDTGNKADQKKVDNIMMVLDAEWDRLLDADQNLIDADNSGTAVVMNKIPGAYITAFVHPDSGKFKELYDWGNEGTAAPYITLDGFRLLINKIVQETAKDSAMTNKVMEKFEITYPSEDNGDTLNTDGTWVDYLRSADPEKLLLLRGSGANVYGYSDVDKRLSNYYTRDYRLLYYQVASGDTGNIKNILLGRPLIMEALGARQGSTLSLPAGGKSVQKVFEAIFEAIRRETGGIIDLDISPELNIADTSKEESPKLVIRERNYAPTVDGKNPAPIGFALYSLPQKHYIESDVWNLSAKVPKSLAAKAFIRDSNFIATEDTTQSSDSDEVIEDVTKINVKELLEELDKLSEKWVSSETPAEDTTRMQEIMHVLYHKNVNSETDDNKTKQQLLKDSLANKNIQTSLELTMKSFGINGWYWGHALAIDPIPSTAPSNTLFSINKITHDIKSSAKDTQYQWTTTLGLLARVVPVDEKTGIKYYGRDPIS